jgi:hypothetical protein
MVSGLWPLVHMRSFEAVFGPKTDLWLVRTVAGLPLTNGVAMGMAPPDPGGQRTAPRIGIGTAATLAGIDLFYAPRGRISRMYLLDAATELGWIACWFAGPEAPPSVPQVCRPATSPHAPHAFIVAVARPLPRQARSAVGRRLAASRCASRA